MIIIGRKYTEAQAKATKAYLEKQAEIKIWLPPESKERFKQAAKSYGMSMNQFIISCVETVLKKEG